MKKKGFILNKLVILGGKDLKSELTFKKGLNVIVGPSNTGKSFAVECLDYMLGAKDKPELIDEIAGYEKIFLELQSNEGEIYTLERSLEDGKTGKYNCAFNDLKNNMKYEKLAQKHSKKSESISSFLLKLSGYDNTEQFVKKNKKNEVQRFTYRTFNHLTLIDELRILTKNSPIYSDNNSQHTAELAAFKFILTRIDDSNTKTKINSNNNLNKIYQAKIETIDLLIKDLELEIVDTEVEFTQSNVNEQITELIEISSALSKDIQKNSDERKEVWQELQKVDSLLITNQEMLKRFYLLEEQYKNDKKRLLFLIEGEHYFSLLNFEQCPECNQKVDYSNRECDHQINEVKHSYTIELEKITKHLVDLRATIVSMEEEKQFYSLEMDQLRTRFQIISMELDEQLTPKNEKLKKEIQDLLRRQKASEVVLQRKNTLNKMLNHKKQLIDLLVDDKEDVKDDMKVHINLETYLEELCEDIKYYLSGWNYPGYTKIEFDEIEKDIVISDKPRRTYGKGYRSIAYSAFILGVMKYCIENGLPHPRNVILDSPITSYKEGDSEEEKTSTDLQDNFFEFLVECENESQVIIFENKRPPLDTHGKINLVEFTKNENMGRYGFIEK